MPVQEPEYPAGREPLTSATARELADGFQTTTTAEVLAPPSSAVTDRLWSIVTSSFAIVFIASALALIAGMYLPVSSAVAPELVHSLFIGSGAFLAGLLAPTPSRR